MKHFVQASGLRSLLSVFKKPPDIVSAFLITLTQGFRANAGSKQNPRGLWFELRIQAQTATSYQLPCRYPKLY